MPSYRGRNAAFVANPSSWRATAFSRLPGPYLPNFAFTAKEKIAGQDAARRATEVSRRVFQNKLSGRPLVAPRRGRPTTSGRFAEYINWDYNGRTAEINLDLNYLDNAAPYWAIQEIGTDKSATIYDSIRGPIRVSIPSQKGRKIAWNLVWADAPGGMASAPQRGRRDQQLFLRSSVKSGHLSVRRHMRIKREIRGKHFLRDGAKSGFAQYRRDVVRAFKSSYT